MNLSSYNAWLCSKLLHKFISGFASFALCTISYLKYSKAVISFRRTFLSYDKCVQDRKIFGSLYLTANQQA